jgi:hypothetical protein
MSHFLGVTVAWQARTSRPFILIRQVPHDPALHEYWMFTLACWATTLTFWLAMAFTFFPLIVHSVAIGPWQFKESRASVNGNARTRIGV